MRRRLLLLAAPAFAVAALGIVLVRRDWEQADCPEGCVVAFGDSITFGTGLTPDESYPAQLAELITFPVWNAGVSGDTVADGRRRLDPILTRHKPRVVVVLLGINDAGVFGPPTPLATFVEDLRAIVTSIQTAGATPILCSLLPIETDVLAQDGVRIERWDIYDGAVRDVADSMEVPLVDLRIAVGAQSGLFLDGLHPNSNGSAVIARAVAQEVELVMVAPDTQP